MAAQHTYTSTHHETIQTEHAHASLHLLSPSLYSLAALDIWTVSKHTLSLMNLDKNGRPLFAKQSIKTQELSASPGLVPIDTDKDKYFGLHTSTAIIWGIAASFAKFWWIKIPDNINQYTERTSTAL